MYCAIRKVHEVYKNLPFITLEVQALMVTNRFPRYGSIPPAWILGSGLYYSECLVSFLLYELKIIEISSARVSALHTLLVLFPSRRPSRLSALGLRQSQIQKQNMETICSIGAKSQRND